MEIERLIEQLRRFGGELGATPLNNVIGKYMLQAADDLEKLQAELDRYRSHHKRLSALPDCNTCNSKDCTYRPNIGAFTRINCPLWRGQKED